MCTWPSIVPTTELAAVVNVKSLIAVEVLSVHGFIKSSHTLSCLMSWRFSSVLSSLCMPA